MSYLVHSISTTALQVNVTFVMSVPKAECNNRDSARLATTLPEVTRQLSENRCDRLRELLHFHRHTRGVLKKCSHPLHGNNSHIVIGVDPGRILVSATVRRELNSEHYHTALNFPSVVESANMFAGIQY